MKGHVKTPFCRFGNEIECALASPLHYALPRVSYPAPCPCALPLRPPPPFPVRWSGPVPAPMASALIARSLPRSVCLFSHHKRFSGTNHLSEIALPPSNPVFHSLKRTMTDVAAGGQPEFTFCEGTGKTATCYLQIDHSPPKIAKVSTKMTSADLVAALQARGAVPNSNYTLWRGQNPVAAEQTPAGHHAVRPREQRHLPASATAGIDGRGAEQRRPGHREMRAASAGGIHRGHRPRPGHW